MIQRTAPSGKVDTHDYDELDRLALSHYSLPVDPTGDDLQQIATDYDANSNPIAMHETYSGVSGIRTTLKRYDHFDRLEQVTNVFDKTIAYRYDLNGNRLSMTDPDGKQTRYEYDKRNRISHITTQNQGSTSYEYDRSDRVKTIDYPNHSQVSNVYDAAGRLKVRSNRLNSVIVSEFLYDYDKNGNRIKQTEHRASLDEDTHYFYDPLERLQRVNYPDETTTYTYDGNYNRVSEQTKDSNDSIIVDKTYSNDDRNKLMGIIDNLDNSQNVSYTHDPNGNQTSKTKAGETTFYRYDVRNQLSQVKDGLVSLGRYGYDYQGLRISKEDDNSEVLLYSYDDQSVLLQSDENGVTQNRYTYGGYHLIALTDKNQISQFYLHDGLGSVVDLLGYDSQIKASYQYDAFGNYRSKTETDTVNDFGFTGHEMDDETSLVYMKARFYDPDSARFLTEDSNLGTSDNPPSLNRYLYSYNNPVRYIDPDGNEAIPIAPGASPHPGGLIINEYWKNFGPNTPINDYLVDKFNDMVDYSGDKIGNNGRNAETQNILNDLRRQSEIDSQAYSKQARAIAEKEATSKALNEANNATYNSESHSEIGSNNQNTVKEESGLKDNILINPQADPLAPLPPSIGTPDEGYNTAHDGSDQPNSLDRYESPADVPSIPNKYTLPIHEQKPEDNILLRERERDEKGRYKASTDIPDGRLNRANPWADTKRQIQEQAKTQDLYNPETGNYIDSNTGLEIEGDFHYGHSYGNESWKSRDDATRQGKSQAEYNSEQQDSAKWQIEEPKSNMSHKYEKKY